MAEATFWVGIDAGADTLAICVKDDAGSIVGEAPLPAHSSEVCDYLAPYRSIHPLIIGIEAGSTAVHLTRALREDGYAVRVLETRFANGFLQIQQNKTDRNDARGLADVVRLMSAAPMVRVKSPQIQALRSQLVLRHQLVRQRVAIENAIRGVFRLNAGKIERPTSATNLQQVVKAELARLKATGIDLSPAVGPVLEVATFLRRTIELEERRLKRIAKEIAVCRRLMTVPGVGPMCALSFYTAIEDPARFERNNDVAAYLGLVPRVSQSGTRLRRGRISKRGNVMTRTHLVTSAKSMLGQAKVDCAAKRWALSLREKAGRKKAAIALAKKLSVIMLALWKSGANFESDREKNRRSAIQSL